MKKYLLLIAVLTMILALAFLFTACRKEESGLDEFEQLILSTSSPEENGEAFTNAIYVVIPHDSGFMLAERAKILADDISDKTGIKTFLKYDSEPTVDGTFELLVGYTSRLISKENIEPLRDEDYICRYDRGSIVLGGKSERSTLAAIQKFNDDILPGASYAALMSENAHFVFEKSRAVFSDSCARCDVFVDDFFSLVFQSEYGFSGIGIFRKYCLHTFKSPEKIACSRAGGRKKREALAHRCEKVDYLFS